MDNFAQLVAAIESAGITGHDAYELANHVDEAVRHRASPEDIQKIAQDIVANERATREALNLQGEPLMRYICSSELADAQLALIEELANDTIPQGQTFFLQGNGAVLAIENNLLPLFKAQHAESIDSGEIQQIVISSLYTEEFIAAADELKRQQGSDSRGIES